VTSYLKYNLEYTNNTNTCIKWSMES